MTFLNPLVLLGLAAAAIPLIIHLFNFRRPRRVDFSSLAFLKELQKTTMQRVRVKQWLLLALRTLALACLVLAFARPTLDGSLGAIGGRAASSIAVVVDNSLSMTLRDAQGEYLDQAKALAAGLVEAAEEGDEVFVLTTADDPATAPTAYTNRGPALDALAEVEPELGAQPLARALDRAGRALAESSELNREIYLVGDLQQSTLLDSLSIDVPGGARVVVLPVGDRAHGNVAVTDVRVDSRIVEAGQPVRIRATLANFSTEPVEDYVAGVLLEGERVAQSAVTVPAGGTAEVRFTATPQGRGWLAGTVQVEDDAFEQDNARYFTLHVPERRRLLVVQGEGQRTDYLSLALSPEIAEGRVAFEAETIREDALAATALGGYDAVLLVGPRTLSSGEVQALARYVEGGGGLLLFPHAAAEPSDYDALLGALGGGRVGGYSGTVGAGQAVASFDRVDLEHPLFEGVFDGAARRVRVESPTIYASLDYVPGGADEQTLIAQTNGRPFLQEIRHGDGVAFVMSVAPEPSWSDLPVRGLFVPLIYRSVFYLSSGEAVSGEGLVTGAGGELRLAGTGANEPLRLVSPLGEELVPEQRTLFGATLLEVGAGLETPGVYDVRAGDALVRRVAVNADRRESDLAVLAPSVAAERLGEAADHDVQTLAVGAGAERLAETLSEARSGVELWNVFLLLALLFLIAEMVVAKQWRPEAVAA